MTGPWQQTNSNSPDSYQRAVITENTISIDWVSDAEAMTAVYWVGTYVPPSEPGDAYTWDSQNDTTQTENALMASSDATKTFTYQDGVLSYELTAVGVTMTVQMQKQ
ncbi:hypothetical protein [Microbacterium radiodurans]|uniref:Uncharacterized protein n=1 Tax=Microbacterium radiodurans TaxID=661398 RepID=A0A5J5IQU2_9MICO|nr:hypothetical protein [Microbacterium radiodurans]KAA9083751.1 hypothetical protein F6B42_14460 [Microbacterium radiodurans]